MNNRCTVVGTGMNDAWPAKRRRRFRDQAPVAQCDGGLTGRSDCGVPPGRGARAAGTDQLQVVPLRVNGAGVAGAPLAVKPKLTAPLVGMLALWLSLVTVTFAPVCWKTPFQWPWTD